ncbi:Gfo/Idh/MocA family protein [Oryzobacter terrae]|uniref:Gfo/Idh/MocA family protein n=1 Tax=Oryzobacter terrae TaxID=1620385 RepID=UPI00366F31FE
MPGLVVVRGLGSIGRRHARVLRSMGHDVRGWPVRPRDGEHDDDDLPLLRDDEAFEAMSGADLVVVATDTARHVDDALAALTAGARRVLVEKPVAPTAADAERLLAHPLAAERVTVAAPLRAHRGFDRFRTAVAALPVPRHAAVVAQSWLPSWRPGRDYRDTYAARADEGGALRDLVHEVDYAAVAFGEPRHVSAVLDLHGPLEMEAEQGATLLWETDSGSVTVRVDYVTRPSRRGAVVTSSGGSVAWDPLTATVSVVTADGEETTTSTPEDLDRDAVMQRQAGAALAVAPTAPLAERLAAGAPASLDEGVLAVRLCDDARSSSPERSPRP